MHFELNNYKEINGLNRAVAQRDLPAFHDRVMKKNVPSQMSPTETILQPEHFYFSSRNDTKVGFEK